MEWMMKAFKGSCHKGGNIKSDAIKLNQSTFLTFYCK